MSQQKPILLHRLLKIFAKWLGLGVAAGALLSSAPLAAQTLAYRPSDGAPAAWREFALLVKSRLQEWLARDDDEAARHFRTSLDAHSKADRAPTIVARIWVTADGKIERAEFDGLEVADAVELRAILAQKNIGAPPPADMMQPLHLKLSLQGGKN